MHSKAFFLCLIFLFASMCFLTPAVQAHHLEPISTEYALPFAPKAGTWEITYEFEREGRGANQ